MENGVITVEAYDATEAHQIDPHNLRHARRVEDAVKALAQEMRQVFNMADIAFMRLGIEVKGRVTGDLKVEFTISAESYGGDVTGHSIQPAMIELLRRNGWDQRHIPKCLSYDGNDKDTEEVPF